MSLAKKCLLSVVVATVGVSQVRCTDEEVATAVGIAAIAAGATAIAVAHDNDHHHRRHRPPPRRHRGPRCEGGYRTSCTTHTDYWGNVRRECREVYDSCIRRVDTWSSYSSGNFANSFAGENLDVAEVSDTDMVTDFNWAETFNMSFEGSAKFIDAMKAAKEGKAQALSDIGLSRNDVKFLARKKMPSHEGLDGLSKALNQDIVTTRNMVMTLLQYAQ